MTTRPAFAALTLTFAVAAACTPSSTGARQPTLATDSAASPPAPTPGTAPEPMADDTTSPTVPDVAPQPVAPPPVAIRPMRVPHPSGPYRVRVVDGASHNLPTYYQGGREYVMGTVGSRYSIVVTNPTARRVEAVVSVDGLDAMDGHPADYVQKRGYILAPYGSMTVDGFRTSFDNVATFRFSSVADSYAGRLGQARDVGVIGVAFFPEQEPVYVPPPPPVAVAPARPMYRHSAPTTPPGLPAPAPLANADRAEVAPPAPKASGASGRMVQQEPERRGLGTEFGEARESHIETVAFERANGTTPSEVVAIRYNDRAGLIALGIPVQPIYPSADVSLRETAEPFRTNGFAQPPPPRVW